MTTGYGSIRAAFMGLDAMDMYPRVESAFCVLQEASFLLQLHLDLERCFRASGAKPLEGWGGP